MKKVEESSNTVEKGLIMEQDIEPGEKIELSKNPVIEFKVSSGPEAISMRDLSGYTEAGVTDYARDNGLSLQVSSEYSDSVPEGQVIRQSPEAGQTIYEGTQITVVFSKGTGELSFTEDVDIPYAPARTGSDGQKVANQIKIYIEDMNHNFNSPVSQIEITEDTTVTLNFTVKDKKTAKYRIVRDGTVIEESVVSP